MLDYIKKRYRIFKRQHPSSTEIGTQIHHSVQFVSLEHVRIGRFVFLGPKSFLDCSGGVDIGDGTIVSSEVVILSTSHNWRSSESIPYGGSFKDKEVVLGKGVWLGYRSMILPGVRLGDGAIVSAGSVVRGCVPKHAIVAGNPATVVGFRNVLEGDKLIESECYYMKRKYAL